MHPFLDLQSHDTPIGASIDAAEAMASSRQTARSVRDLETQLDRALLACEAMWSLIRDRLGVTDVDLAQRVNDIDLSDGNLDGKIRRTPVSCPKCKRTISPRLPKCMYCGQAIVHQPFA